MGGMIIEPSADSAPSASDPEVRVNTSQVTRTLHALTPLLPAPLQVWDVVVVGAGVAGSALAYKLGQARASRQPSCVCAQRRLASTDPVAPLPIVRTRRRAVVCCFWSAI
jgi:hypothetical protein